MKSSTVDRREASELRVFHWIDGEGNPRPPPMLSDLGTGHKVIYMLSTLVSRLPFLGIPDLEAIGRGP